MKKILLAFDGTQFSYGGFELVRRLNELEPVLVTGVFLPQVTLANLWSYAGGMGSSFIPMLEQDESERIKENIAHFERLCIGNQIDYRVHKDFFDFAIPELKKESIFADLVILGSETFYASASEFTPNEYLQEALHDLRCPVLLVPEKFEFPKSIILSYDGTEESVFAIKQFAYLFPELTDIETILVYADEDRRKGFPEKSEIEELTGRHFRNLTFMKLHVDPEKHFTTWLANRKSGIVVSGAYGRSNISLFFKKSFIRNVIREHRLPIFIAHK